jgi:D-alanyl-D-alanine carboxypeptidase (penicillin-binding protein 5/6)
VKQHSSIPKVKNCLIWILLVVSLSPVLIPGILAAEETPLPATPTSTPLPSYVTPLSPPCCRAAVVMEASSGDVIYKLNADQPLPPASMVKMMLIYIAMKRVQAGELHLTDLITTSAHASKMGGSQVYLKHGEQFTLEEMLQAVIIQSANDAAMAIAEHIAGSARGFVDMMNATAEELGMTHTTFHSPHGLPPARHQKSDLSSALDMAILARAIITEFPEVLKWSKSDQVGFREDTFIMTNTNKLIRSFPGCDGLKTGYYREAGFNVTATAKQKNVRIIVVVMGCHKGRERFEEAARLLRWGFDQYTEFTLIEKGDAIDKTIPVTDGIKVETTPTAASTVKAVVLKKRIGEIIRKIHLVSELPAPVEPGAKCGEITFLLDDRVLGHVDLVTDEAIPELGFWAKCLRFVGLK